MDKGKAMDYIRTRIDKSHQYNAELESARQFAASAAAANAAQNVARAAAAASMAQPPAFRPATTVNNSPTPLPKSTNKMADMASLLASDIGSSTTTTSTTSNPTSINKKLTTLDPAKFIPQTLTPAQLKKVVDPYQELQAVQSIMSFATPEQFHYTDRKLGEWFDTKAWVDIYGYPEVKMCAPIDEAFETEDELFGAVSLFQDRHYLVNYRPSTNKIYLSYEEECEHDDLLQSLLVATRLAYYIRKNGPPTLLLDGTTTTESATTTSPDGGDGTTTTTTRWAAHGMIRESLQWCLRYEDQIIALLAESDWDVDELTWPDTGTRVYWEIKDEPKVEEPHASLNDGNVPPPIDVANIVGSQ